MIDLVSRLFGSGVNIDVSKNQISGSPQAVAKYVHGDIVKVKAEIKQFYQVTGNNSSFHTKVLRLLESSHSQEVNSLKESFHHDTSSISYQRQLLALYKKQLLDWHNLLESLHYNHNHGIHQNHMESRNYEARNSSLSSINSRLSLVTSNSNSTDNDTWVQEADANAPDHLVDPISFTLFSDPVITPSGITYEKSVLLNYLNEKGKMDPLTRTPLKESQLYPNLVVKDAVSEYIKERRALCGQAAQ